MNVSAKSQRGVQYIAFNQDYSCISVATNQGFKIYNCASGALCYSRSDGAIRIVEMLFCTSLVVLVGAGHQPALSPRVLTVFNTATNTAIASLSFMSVILAVRLNRKRLVVVLEGKVSVLDLSSLRVLQVLDTPPNTKGKSWDPTRQGCAHLHLAVRTAILPCPQRNVAGPCSFTTLCICKPFVKYIQAHKSTLAALTFSADGTLLATASEKGTVIPIYSLSFSPASPLMPPLLCAASDAGTVHLFRLDGVKPKIGAGSGFLAAVVPSSAMEPAVRSAASLRLADPRVPCSCASVAFDAGDKEHEVDEQANLYGSIFDVARSQLVEAEGKEYVQAVSMPHESTIHGDSSPDERLRALLVSADGIFYEYCVNLQAAGSQGAGCTLEREVVLVDSVSEQISARFM
eukprot:jgi/Chlat1/7616/Chrsp64S07161